ncbi:hypothetical protein NIES73_24490 [Sphaerospermopsis kisseleviana NIES-73]|nr:hypothetical protein NIES73_24490 [Sphaerospermopsis kisseleviana NIES-73]
MLLLWELSIIALIAPKNNKTATRAVYDAAVIRLPPGYAYLYIIF